MDLKISQKSIHLLLFSVAISILTYGFTLNNFCLSIDNEQVFHNRFSLDLGRWGTNLVRSQIFEGITPYFTLLISLILMSMAAVEMARLFKLNTVMSYVFCGLFLSFPQMAYQFIFLMQSDAVALGFLLSAFSVRLFVEFVENTPKLFSPKTILIFIATALLLMFVIAIYQALIFIPAILFLIYAFQKTYETDYKFKIEIKNLLLFGVLMLLSVALYYISVKIICPEMGTMDSYTSGSSDNRFVDFYNLWLDNIRGNMYYGEKTFVVASLLSLALVIKFAFDKKHFLIRTIALFLMLFVPFFISFFITTGSNPPRIYVTSGIVFAFIIVHFFASIKVDKLAVLFASTIMLANIYFVTNLYLANYRITNHDIGIAKKIDNAILTQYPDFNPNENYVYFYGSIPYGEHEKFRLPNSEIFAGSFFQWDNGSNNRIINFIKYNDVAYYKEIDNKETYLKIKDSIEQIPVWPKPGYIKMIDNVIIVKLGKDKGSNLSIE